MNNIFTDEAVKKEPRLAQADFDFSEIMDLNNDFAFVSGSVIEGFGNQASDVDIYIVSKMNVGFPDGKKNNYTNEQVGYYNEINWFSYDWHRRVAKKINNLQLNSLLSNLINYEELSYYYRTAIGVPLINPLLHRTETVEYSKQRILDVLEYCYGYQAYKALKYSKQLLGANEIEQGYFWINKAMRRMVDSVLAANGEGYMSNKYRLSKIERAFGRKSDLYINTKKFRCLGKYEMIAYINDVTSFIEDLGVNKFHFDDTVIKYKISGTIEQVDLYHHYVVHNAGNVYQMDEDCLTILEIIREGYDSRESIQRRCEESKRIYIDYNRILSQLQAFGILEIK